MNVWIIRCVAGGTVWYRAKMPEGIVWTTCLDHADVYTDDTLPPGNWDKINAEEVS